MESILTQDGARLSGGRREQLRKDAAHKGLSVPAKLVEEVKIIAGQAG
jgi:hypothetical protein